MRSLIARRDHSHGSAGSDDTRSPSASEPSRPGGSTTPPPGGYPPRPGAGATGTTGPSSQPAGGPAAPTTEGTPARPPWLQPEGGTGSATPAASAGTSQAEERRTTENTLIVGPNIKLKGEIAACDTLVVEGTIEASMDSHHIAIAKGGVFSGQVTVDTAEVAGSFDGELTVRDRLLVRASGKISGTVRYGALEVEHGGRLSGTMDLLSDAERSAPRPAPAPAQAAPVSPTPVKSDEDKARPDDRTTTPPHATTPATGTGG